MRLTCVKEMVNHFKITKNNVKCKQNENKQNRNVESSIDILSLGQFNMTKSFQIFINEIDPCNLRDLLTTRHPEISHITIPDKLRDVKVFPMNTLMAELSVTNLQPMKSSSWLRSFWFDVVLTLATVKLIGLYI